MLKIQHRSPIVAKILAHLACSTGTAFADIAFHGRVEGIAADDVVDVGGGRVAGFDDGVEAGCY